jgi:hypothetical protein
MYRDGAYYWDVTFTNDNRLPRMGRGKTFNIALRQARRCIEVETRGAPVEPKQDSQHEPSSAQA